MTYADVPTGARGHPYCAQHIEDLPPSLLAGIVDQEWAGQSYDLIFIIPPQLFLRGFMGVRHVPWQALLFNSKGILYIRAVKSQKDSPQVTWLEAQHLLKIRLSLILLYGRLEFWTEFKGSNNYIDIEFNTVSFDKIKTSLHSFLRHSWPPVQSSSHSIPSQWEDISYLPLKFFNGLDIYAIQPDENIIGTVFQPEINEKIIGSLTLKRTPKTLLAITDRQFIVIEEELNTKSPYGWVFTYCSHHCIKGLSVSNFKKWQKARIALSSSNPHNDIEIQLEPTQMERLQEIWRAVFPAYE